MADNRNPPPFDARSKPGETPPNPTWDRVQLARHPKRPHTLDYITRIFTDFSELHGDRAFADDPAIVGGMAFFDERPVMVIGQQKGRDTKQKLLRNFGMPKPEGYRKAMRLMRLGGQIPPAHRDVPRYAGRLSGHRRRRARPGRSHRGEPARDVAAWACRWSRS